MPLKPKQEEPLSIPKTVAQTAPQPSHFGRSEYSPVHFPVPSPVPSASNSPSPSPSPLPSPSPSTKSLPPVPARHSVSIGALSRAHPPKDQSQSIPLIPSGFARITDLNPLDETATTVHLMSSYHPLNQFSSRRMTQKSIPFYQTCWMSSSQRGLLHWTPTQ